LESFSLLAFAVYVVFHLANSKQPRTTLLPVAVAVAVPWLLYQRLE
jgi:hypothetical protein